MDVFIEYLVRKKSDAKDWALITLTGVGGIIVIAALVFYGLATGALIGGLLLAAAVGVGYLMWRVISSFNIEFEYSLTNGEIDIDKIMAQRSRKRIITFDARKAESFGHYKKEEHAGKSYNTVVMACTNPNNSEKTYYITLHHPKKGHTLVTFTPNERILEGIKSFIPRVANNEADKRS